MIVTMTNDVLGLPRGRSLTRADLDAMPDDGHRCELIDGVLVVSPAPRINHQGGGRQPSPAAAPDMSSSTVRALMTPVTEPFGIDLVPADLIDG